MMHRDNEASASTPKPSTPKHLRVCSFDPVSAVENIMGGDNEVYLIPNPNPGPACLLILTLPVCSFYPASAVENIMGRDNEVDHLAIPAACFTHPEIAMVGLTEEQAKEKVL